MSKSKRKSSGHTRSGSLFTELVFEVFRLNGGLLASGDRLTKPIGLTSARWQVMGTLRNSPEPITVSQIARNMGLQRQSVQRSVNLLVDEGAVTLVDNPNHGRARLVVLTPKGRKVLQEATRLQVEWANETARGIDPASLKTAVDVLADLRQRLERRRLTG